MLRLTNDVLIGMGKKQVIFRLQFDFSKEFDTITPSQLLVKLRDLGHSHGYDRSFVAAYSVFSLNPRRLTTGKSTSVSRKSQY